MSLQEALAIYGGDSLPRSHKKNLTGVANANNLHAQPAAAACRNKRMFYVYNAAAARLVRASDSRNGGRSCLVLQM